MLHISTCSFRTAATTASLNINFFSPLSLSRIQHGIVFHSFSASKFVRNFHSAYFIFCNFHLIINFFCGAHLNVLRNSKINYETENLQ